MRSEYVSSAVPRQNIDLGERVQRSEPHVRLLGDLGVIEGEPRSGEAFRLAVILILIFSIFYSPREFFSIINVSSGEYGGESITRTFNGTLDLFINL